MTPKEWRNIRVGYPVSRIAGGSGYIAHLSRDKATIRFSFGKFIEVSYEHLFKHYKPS